jgi:hypothetical protein
MTELSLDDLFKVAEAAPLLEEAEASLRGQGQEKRARSLSKLQQDAGVMIARRMDPDYDPMAGPETARLEEAFSPVTTARALSVLEDCRAFVDGPLQKGLEDLRREMTPLPPSVFAGHLRRTN